MASDDDQPIMVRRNTLPYISPTTRIPSVSSMKEELAIRVFCLQKTLVVCERKYAVLAVCLKSFIGHDSCINTAADITIDRMTYNFKRMGIEVGKDDVNIFLQRFVESEEYSIYAQERKTLFNFIKYYERTFYIPYFNDHKCQPALFA